MLENPYEEDFMKGSLIVWRQIVLNGHRLRGYHMNPTDIIRPSWDWSDGVKNYLTMVCSSERHETTIISRCWEVPLAIREQWMLRALESLRDVPQQQSQPNYFRVMKGHLTEIQKSAFESD